jgi:hypothetical protein
VDDTLYFVADGGWYTPRHFIPTGHAHGGPTACLLSQEKAAAAKGAWRPTWSRDELDQEKCWHACGCRSRESFEGKWNCRVHGECCRPHSLDVRYTSLRTTLVQVLHDPRHLDAWCTASPLHCEQHALLCHAERKNAVDACHQFRCQAGMGPKKGTNPQSREEAPWFPDTAERVRERKARAVQFSAAAASADHSAAEEPLSSLPTPAERRAEAIDHLISGFEPQPHTAYVLGRPMQAPRAPPCT